MKVTLYDSDAIFNGALRHSVTLAKRLGLRDRFDSHIDLENRPGRANVGRQDMVIVASILDGADWIDSFSIAETKAQMHVLTLAK